MSAAEDTYAAEPANRVAADDRYVRAVLRRLTVDPHLVDDLAQDTWLALLRQPSGSLLARRAWMGTVARNFVLQISRTSPRRERRERAAARPEVVHGDSVDGDVIRAVREELDALSPRYREVLRLRFFDDLPPTLIADRLGMPIETARTRLKRGLAQLHARLIARRSAGG